MMEPEKGVLDSSVVLAALKAERSDLNLIRLIEGSVLGAVNLSEILAKAAEFGLLDRPLLPKLLNLIDRVEPFTSSQAKVAASLRLSTRAQGLSFGDRACLALALELGLPVYTAEHRWSETVVGCDVRLIRSRQTTA